MCLFNPSFNLQTFPVLSKSRAERRPKIGGAGHVLIQSLCFRIFLKEKMPKIVIFVCFLGELRTPSIAFERFCFYIFLTKYGHHLRPLMYEQLSKFGFLLYHLNGEIINLRSLLNKLACLIVFSTVERASLFNRDLRVLT